MLKTTTTLQPAPVWGPCIYAAPCIETRGTHLINGDPTLAPPTDGWPHFVCWQFSGGRVLLPSRKTQTARLFVPLAISARLEPRPPGTEPFQPAADGWPPFSDTQLPSRHGSHAARCKTPLPHTVFPKRGTKDRRQIHVNICTVKT